MTFWPSDYLTVEIYAGGAWITVPPSDVGDTVTIKRGRTAEGQDIDPSSARFKLRGAGGRYSPRNPRSDLFGLIGRGTPVRIGVTPPATGTLSYRFWGEVVAWPVKWSDVGEVSAYVDVEAAGVMRRLAQGLAPLQTPYRIGMEAVPGLLAYWPCEEPSGASQAGQARGSYPMKVTGSGLQFAGESGFKATAYVPTLGGGGLSGAVKSSFGALVMPSLQVRFLAKLDASIPADTVLLRVRTKVGKLARVDLHYSTGGALYVKTYDDDGALVKTTGTYGFALDGVRALVSLELSTSGTTVTVAMSALPEGATTGATASETITSASIGYVKTVEVNPGAKACGSTAIGHVSVQTTITSLFALADNLKGWEGETAQARIVRLAAGAGLTLAYTGSASSLPMGAQSVATALELMRDAARTDGGLLYEPRGVATDLSYVTGRSLYLRDPALSIAGTDNLLDLEPTDDDSAIRNVVTVTRAGGATATERDDTGPLGTAAVGTYDEALTLSLASDDAADDQAAWRVHLGTVDAARWPTVALDLAHPTIRASSALTTAALAVSMGNPIRITELPGWLPPAPVEVMVQGYEETITPARHRLAFACTPGEPYRVGRFDNDRARFGGAGTVLAGALSSSATSVAITPPAGTTWGHASGDYDVMCGGERMTVTAVSGTTLTVVRGVNGITRAHAAGEGIDLAEPVWFGL